MLQDMHLHSDFSDGNNSIEDMVRCALELGMKRICFTDHVWETSGWTDKYFKEIQRCQNLFGTSIDVLCGVEAKFLSCKGGIDVNDDLFGKGVRVVAAMHRIPCGNGKFIRASEIKNNLDVSRKFWMETIKGIQNNKHIDCLAHPFSLLGYMGITQQDDDWWGTVSTIIGSLPVSIEYNVKYDNQIVPEWFWETHKNKIMPASDSHSVKEFRIRSSELRSICEKFS